jgi:protein tyrosine/serine phosphatase
MNFNRQTYNHALRGALTTCVAVFAFVLATHAQQLNNESANAEVEIKNFGQMDEKFYRGAQPENEEDYRALAKLGIKTVIDLRHDPKSYERPMVEALGMRYINIPMKSKTRPTEEQAREFMRIANDPATGKFFAHCAGGRHRTGAMGAVYRYENYDWNFDQVYAEMKSYDFYTRNRHGSYKDFVFDYYERIRSNQTTEPASPRPFMRSFVTTGVARER